MPHLRRWRSFHLRSDTSEGLLGYLDLSDAGLLKDLSISLSPRGHSYFVILAGNGSFERLHLQGVHVPWDSTRLSGLRYLQLHDIEGAAPTLHQLQAILVSSPNLERLVLDGLSDSENADPSSSGDQQPIRLLKLATLVLRDVPLPIIRHLLSTIQTSSRCAVFVQHLPCDYLQEDAIRNFFSKVIAPWLRTSRPLHITSSVPRRLISFCTSPCPVSNPWSNEWWTSNDDEGVFLSLKTNMVGNSMQDLASLIKQSGGEPPIALTWETELATPTVPFGTANSFPLPVLDDLVSIRSLCLRGRPGTEVILRYMSQWQMDGNGRSRWPCPRMTSLDLRFARDITPRDVQLFRAGRWGSAVEQANPFDDPFAIRRPAVLKDLRL